METKSRYEVLSDLEAKKRELILQRDSLIDVSIAQEQEIKVLERNIDSLKVVFDREIKDLERQKEHLTREKSDYLVDWDRKLKDLDTTKEDIERKREDNNIINSRKIEDLITKLKNYKDTIEQKKETIKDLIISVDESIKRFNIQQNTK